MQILKRPMPNGQMSQNYYLRVERGGKAYLRSLGTPVKAMAKEYARKLLGDIEARRWGMVEATKRRSDMSTVGEVIQVYLKNATDVRTRKRSAQAMDRILRRVLGKGVENTRLTELNPQLIREYERISLEEVGTEFRRYKASSPRIRSDYSVRQTIKHDVAHARSIFAADKMRFYDGSEMEKLQDLQGFLREPLGAPKVRRPQRPDEAGLERMLTALPQLKAEKPAVYCAWLLMARLGMRPIEVMASREHWVRRAGSDFVMEIIERPEETRMNGNKKEVVAEAFNPKGSEGEVPIGADVWAELQQYAQLRTDGFLIPGRNKTERAAVVQRDLSRFVAQFIRGRGTSTSYELRRWAGSLVLDAHNGDPTAARDFLRHSDIKTTLAWYAYRLKPVKALSMAGLGMTAPVSAP